MDQEKIEELKEFFYFNIESPISSKPSEMENEVIEIKVLEEHHNTENTSKRKRKLTSTVCNFFEMLPLSADNK